MANLINSYNYQYPVSSSGLPQENAQEVIAKSKQVVSDNFESNSAIKTISGASSSEGQTNILRMLPFIWVADKLVDKGFAREGSKSTLSKMASLGDKISHLFHLDNIISEERTGRISNFFKNNRFTKYFTKEYRAIPKASMAKPRSLTQEYTEQLHQALTEKLKDLGYNYNFANNLNSKAISLSDDTLKALSNACAIKTPVSQQYLTSVTQTLKEIAPRIQDVNEQKLLAELQNQINEFLLSPAVKEGSKKVSTKGLAENISLVLSTLKKNHADWSILSSSNPLTPEANRVLNSIAANADDAIAAIPKDKVFSIADELIAQGLDKGDDILAKNAGKITGLRNKINANELKTGKTLLGKLFAKGTLNTKNTLTFGGGLISLYFTASAISQAVKETKEAPKGEKLSTFMHVISEQYLGMILFQPSINLLYKAGGNKYRGMSVEGRAALTELVQNANRNVDSVKIAKMQQKLLKKGADINTVKSMTGKSLSEAKKIANSLNGGGFIGKALSAITHPFAAIGKLFAKKQPVPESAQSAINEIINQTKANAPKLKETTKIAKMQKDLLLRGVDKDKVSTLTGKGISEAKKLSKAMKKEGAKLKFWEKPLKALGKVLDTGLDTIKSTSKLGKIGGKIKGFAGGFARFALILFVIQPFIQKPITKLCHKIFGEPKTYLAKQKKASEGEKEPGSNPAQKQNTTSTNLLEQWGANLNAPVHGANMTQIPQNIPASPQVQNAEGKTEQKEIPALNIFDKNKKQDRYIPSIEVSFPDDSKELEKQADAILKATDSVMKEARKFL